jgi:hypothetical protein
MNGIKGGIVLMGEIGYDAVGDSHTHAENIDDDKQLVFHHVTERD